MCVVHFTPTELQLLCSFSDSPSSVSPGYLERLPLEHLSLCACTYLDACLLDDKSGTLKSWRQLVCRTVSNSEELNDAQGSPVDSCHCLRPSLLTWPLLGTVAPSKHCFLLTCLARFRLGLNSWWHHVSAFGAGISRPGFRVSPYKFPWTGHFHALQVSPFPPVWHGDGSTSLCLTGLLGSHEIIDCAKPF